MDIIKAVLDTNILVSSLGYRGLSAEIVDIGMAGKFQIVVSNFIINEFQEKVYEKMPELKPFVKLYVKRLKVFSKVVPEQKMNRYRVYGIVKSDPDDDQILTTAIAGKATYIITRDKDILEVKSFRSIQMMKPEHFISLIP